MERRASELWWEQSTGRIDVIVYCMGEIICPGAPAIMPCWYDAVAWARRSLQHDFAFEIGHDPTTFEPVGAVLFVHVDDARMFKRRWR